MTTWFKGLFVFVALVAVGCSGSSTTNTPSPTSPYPTPTPIPTGSGPFDGRIPTQYLNRTAALFLPGNSSSDPDTTRLSEFMFPYALAGSLVADPQIAVLTDKNSQNLAITTQLKAKLFVWLEDELGGWYAEIPSINGVSWRYTGGTINAIFSDKWMTVRVNAWKCPNNTAKACGEVTYRARAQGTISMDSNGNPIPNPTETTCLQASTQVLADSCQTYMNSSNTKLLGKFGDDPRGVSTWTQIQPVTRTWAEWATLP